MTHIAEGHHSHVKGDAAFPQTPAATAARFVAIRFYSPALLNHCIRSYLWGTKYAAEHGIAFDDELLYVSAMLHDIGLTDAFDSHRVHFEQAGGNLAWVFGIAAAARRAGREGCGDHRVAHERRRVCDRRPRVPYLAGRHQLGSGRTATGVVPRAGKGGDARALSKTWIR